MSDAIGAPIRFIEVKSGFLRAVIRQLQWGTDALSASWHRWVLGYSRERQLYLMQLLGIGFLQGPKLAYGMIGITGFCIIFLTLVLLYRVRERRDQVYATYLGFCRRLQRSGIVRMTHEGPGDFANRVIAERPDLQSRVARITGLYIGIRYGRQDTKLNRRRFRNLVRGFHP